MRRFLILLVLPLTLFAQKSQRYPSLLWKISGNGLKKPSYLYGTMHVSNKLAFNLSEQFFEALQGVDVVGLETNPGEWLDGMEQTGELTELNRFRPTALTANFYESAFKPALADRRMLQGILSYDPDIIDGLLYRQNQQHQNFEVSTYIDLFIFQSAAKLNKKIISLESFGLSEIKSRLAAIPDSGESNSYADRNAYQGFQKIEDAYRDGNLDLLDSLSRHSGSKNNQKYLIEDRNDFFAATIDSVLKKQSIFSGVGAAHLPGSHGLIELLRAKGYSVEPVFPHITKRSHKRREELDAMVKPVTFQKQFAIDSTFSVQVPGKLYSLVNLENLKYQIHADMVNGSFYTIVRLNYFGPLAHLGAQQMLAKLDSLVFENIPGRIVKHSGLQSNNGIKGIEIINETRSGDLQHYQIFVTDMEIVLFKLGGKQQYATGSEAKQFFNSITFKNPPTRIIDFVPPTKGFSVKIPANVLYTKNDNSSLTGLVEDLYAYDAANKTFYGLKQVVYNDFNYLEQDTFELNRLAKYTMSNYGFTINASSSIQREQAYPAIRFSAKNMFGENLSARIIIKGVHYYLQYIVGAKERQWDAEFMTSFRLSDFAYVNNLKDITDKEFCFKAKDEVSEDALSRFNDALSKAYDKAGPKPNHNNDFDYRSSAKYYYSPSSNEYVNLIFEKYNNYDFRDTLELSAKIDETIKKTTSLMITQKQVQAHNQDFSYTCVLRDTACSRAIAMKLIFKSGISVELTAPFDTIGGMHGWMKGFYDSFQLLDSTPGKNLFVSKFERLLTDLRSRDTTVRSSAGESLRNSIAFHKSYLPSYVKFLGRNDLSDINEECRAQLFVNGGTLNSDKIIEPYKKLYKQYTDSFYLQLCLLKGLAVTKTQNAYNAFLQLLTTETPLLGNEASVEDVFWALHDSLPLCKSFFPQMLTLTKYEEYKSAVYSLMSDLVNQGLLKPSVYALHKDQVLDDANLNIKRFNPYASKIIGQSENPFDRLEKSDKEVAENLRWGLECFDNNVVNANHGVPGKYDYYRRAKAIDYAIVLAPFYKSDEKVKQYFQRLAKFKSQNIAMPMLMALLKQGVVFNDSLLNAYQKNTYTKAVFYSELEKEKQISFCNLSNFSQKDLVESLLNSEHLLSKYYAANGQKVKPDSVLFVDIQEVTNVYQHGDLYVYKKPKEKSDPEVWMLVFVPKQKDKLHTNMYLLSSLYYTDPLLSTKENIKQVCEYFTLRYRKRAGEYFDINQQEEIK